MFSGRNWLLLAALTPIIVTLQPANLRAQTANVDARSSPSPRRLPVQETQKQKEKINAWTVGLAGGLIEGAPLRLAAEMARVVDDGPNLHVLPIVTRGAMENLNSLLYLRGVDTAIINSDALESTRFRYRRSGVGSLTCSISSRRSCTSLLGPRSRVSGSRWQESEFQHPGCAFRRRRPRCPAHGDHVIRSMTTRAAHELDGRRWMRLLISVFEVRVKQ